MLGPAKSYEAQARDSDIAKVDAWRWPEAAAKSSKVPSPALHSHVPAVRTLVRTGISTNLHVNRAQFDVIIQGCSME
jgi:hypothetical protein